MKRLALFLLGCLSVLVAAELVFQMLPVSTATASGYHIDPRILTYPRHHRFTIATGWDLKNAQHHTSNNYGFVDNRDFVRDPTALAVIGDSFVEANMLPEGQRIGPALERLLDDTPVYSMGGPGSSLFDYLARAQFAQAHFALRRFVFVIERGDVRQVLCGSGNHHGACFDAQSGQMQLSPDTPPGLLKQLARQSALAQYLFSQLKINPADALRTVRLYFAPPHETRPANEQAADPVSPDLAATIVERFVHGIDALAAQSVILIDGARHNRSQTAIWNNAHMDLLQTMAADKGIPVIDLSQPFERWEAATGLKIEIGPYDAHWNLEGHRIAAEAAAERLQPYTR
ncbi:MAG: hypothetical protein KDE68_11400 [Rhodocyclaceae bacterium]|nr:hypothetical protein [Rhodocyclaceae bacterium]